MTPPACPCVWLYNTGFSVIPLCESAEKETHLAIRFNTEPEGNTVSELIKIYVS